MIRWKDDERTSGLADIASFFEPLSVADTLTVLTTAGELPAVVLPNSCRVRLLTHLVSSKSELGGLLLGRAYGVLRQGETSPLAIHICSAIPSNEFESTGVSLRMDPEIWDRVREQLVDGMLVVGWYHSHPNLGAFFSGTDRRTQSAFFNHPYSLGAVFDPIRGEEKWFLGPSSVEVPPENILSARS